VQPDEDARSSGLLQQYFGELRGFLRRKMHSSQDLDDVAQEIFTRFLRVDRKSLHQPRAYLFGIAAHVIREVRLRALRERDWVTIDSEAVEAAAEHPRHPRADEVAERLSLQRQLLAALAKLPPMQRTVLLMVKHDGLSHEEVAAATHLSVNTIERYVVEARARIKALMWDR
jgi:RNA polymerase sigma-70 factor, ECF subfamily